jgi:chromosome segregation ATPase
MAEFNEDIVINIEIDFADAIQKIAELKQANIDLNNELANMKKSVKDGVLSQNEFNKTQAAAKVQMQQNAEAVRNLEKVIRNKIKANKDNGDSLVAMRAQLSNLTSAYDNLSAAERNAGKGQDLQNQINQTTAAIKVAEEETQRYYRNVGNYGQIAKDMKAQLKEMTNELLGMVEAGKKGSDEYLELQQKILDLKDTMSQQNQTISEITTSINGINGAYGAYKAAAAAAGLETENLDKTMAQLQIVLTVISSFEAMNKALNTSTIGMKAQSAATSLASLVTKAFGATTIATSTAFK